MAIKTSSQSLISRGSTTTAISGFGGGASSSGSSTITSISYLAANGVALTANAAPTVSNSLIKIVGTGFTSGANVYLNGLLQPSANVTFVNSTELRLNMPPLTTNTYSLMTFDSTGAGSVYYPGVRFDPYPIWSNTYFELTTAVSQQLTVTGYGSGSITFSLASGNTLPSGLTLYSNGLMSGTVTGGTYNFYVNVIDSENQISTQPVTLIAVTNITAEYLIVGGGGSGGTYYGGGGGAGGYRTNYGSTAVTLAPSTAYTVTVGAGGVAPAYPNARNPGVASSLIGGVISIESAGGGGGGGLSAGQTNLYPNGQAGGSGGGGSWGNSGQRGLGGAGNTPSVSPSQGNSGGWANYPYDAFPGGGGGAGAVGANATSGPGQAGSGGNGTTNSITGSAVVYAGGGGGGAGVQTNPNWSAGSGGSGGGGAGSGGFGAYGTSGTVNTGGGGGGGSNVSTSLGGDGGSGVVILRTTSTASATTGSPTVTTDAGYNVYKFTASGTITF
jgi:hypothetical protein